MSSIFIASSAVSGDLQGARLARELLRMRPGLRLTGSGGPQMIAAGVDIKVQTAHLASVGIFAACRFYSALKHALDEQKKAILEERPDVAILIDCEGYFNECFCDFLAREKIPIIHYFPPLVWLWGAWRARKIARDAHAIIPAFPNEIAPYEKAGGAVFYFGHPLIDIIGESVNLSEAPAPSPAGKLVGLMPGSRVHEVEILGPPMLDAALAIRNQIPGTKFLLPLAGNHLRERLEAEIARTEMQDDVTLVIDASYQKLRQCDLVVVAAGTATIELTLLGVPMLVVYRLGALTYQVVRFLVKTPFIAMPNILAGRVIVPEMRQDEVNADRIAKEAIRILKNDGVRKEIQAGLHEVKTMLGEPGVLKRVAHFILGELDALKKVRQLPSFYVTSRLAPVVAATSFRQKLQAFASWLMTPLDWAAWKILEIYSGRYYRGRLSRERLGLVGKILCGSSRARSLRNMELVLGPASSRTRDPERFWKTYTEEVGIGTIESIFLARSAPRLRRMISIEGEELLQEALKQGKGVSFLLGHLGPMGVVPSAFGPRGYDITMTGNPLHRPHFERKLQQMLIDVSSSRALLGDNLPQRAAEAFRRNGIFASYVDYMVGTKHGIWLKVGQAEVLGSLAGAIIALRYRTPVFYVRAERRGQQKFHVQLTRLEPETDEAIPIRTRAAHLAQQALQLLEPDLLQRPEEWWPWFIGDVRPIGAAKPNEQVLSS